MVPADGRAFPTLREHYLGVIAKPMDLGLINHKLTNDEYTGREQFVEDLRLVFKNAVEFNRPAAQQAQSRKRTKSPLRDGRPRGEDLRDRDALVELRRPPRARVLQGRHRRPAGDARHGGVDYAERHF